MIPRPQLKTFVLLLVACVLIAVASPFRIAIMGLLVIHALRGSRQTIEAYSIGMFLLYLNTGTFGGLSLASTIRWPLIFAGFARVVWDLARQRKAFFKSPAVPLLLAFSACAVFFGLLVSRYPQISVMKAITFFVTTFTILTAFRLTADQREYWQDWFATIFVFLVLGSVPFLRLLPGAYLGGLFMGILNHSQALGAFLIPFTAWMSVELIRAERRPLLLVATTLLAWYFIYLSGSRTAFVATAGAVFLACAAALLRRGEQQRAILQGMRRLALPLILVVAVAGVLRGPQLVEAFRAFAFKGDATDSYGEAFENSRGRFIQLQMANFHSSPLVGIGFAVPTEQQKDLRIKDSGFLGLPSGASVEKGFLPSAVLEETGLVGALLTLLIMMVLLRDALRQPDPALLALMLGGLLINVGEMVFFSPTAAGMYLWLCAGLATTLPEQPEQIHYTHRSVYVRPSSSLDRLQQVA